jgi:four helix bundle protein
MDLVVLTYSVTTALPDSERFGLCSQMRRAAVSIPSNVAEGHGRKGSLRPFGRGVLYFIGVAIGSVCELDTQMEAALRLGYIKNKNCDDWAAALVRTRQLLYGLRRDQERRIAAAAGCIASVCVIGFAVLRIGGVV